MKTIRWAEFVIDIFLAVDMILNFFTADIIDVDYEKSLSKIAITYLKSYFITDCISCLPGLIIAENIEGIHDKRRWVYYFKVVRYLQISRLFK